MPDTTDTLIELHDTAVVRWSPGVLIVAAELGIQSLLLLDHRIVAVLLAPRGDRLQPSAEPFAHRLHMHCELPRPAAGTHVCQTEEIEGLGLSSPANSKMELERHSDRSVGRRLLDLSSVAWRCGLPRDRRQANCHGRPGRG